MKLPKAKPTIFESVETQDVITLFRDNLNAMRQYYRNEKFSGQNLGHNVVLEMAIADVSKALEAAIEGKPWKPGS